MSLDQLNACSAWMVESLARASLHGGIAVAIAWALCTCVPWLSANAKSWLWRLVFVKTLLALVWFQPLELPVLAPPAARTATLSLPAEANVPVLSEHPDRILYTAEPSAKLTAAADSDRRSQIVISNTARPDPLNGKSLLAIVWLAGFLVALVILARQHFRAHTLRRSVARCTDEFLTDQLIALSRAIGLIRLPALCISSNATRPMLIGILNPALVFPEQILARSSSESLRLMLAHEVAHVRRGDLAWSAFAAFVRALFFFHPLLWLARRESLLAQEIACDELAVRATASTGARYAEMLVDVVALPLSRPPALSLGVAESSRKALERRIRNMKFIGLKPSKWVQFLSAAAVLAALIALVPFSLVAAVPEPVRNSSPRDPVISETKRDVPEQIGRESRAVDSAELQRLRDETYAKQLAASLQSVADVQQHEDTPLSRSRNVPPEGGVDSARLYEQLRRRDRTELRQILPTVTRDTLLISHLQALAEAEQKYAGLRNDYGDEHPEVIKVRSIIKVIDGQIEERIDGLLTGLQVKAQASSKSERALQSQLNEDAAETNPAAPPATLSVHAQVGGIVKEVFVSVGQTVKKGQPLLEIDRSAAERQLVSATLRARIARADVDIARSELVQMEKQFREVSQRIKVGAAGQLDLPNVEKARANAVKAEAQSELVGLDVQEAEQNLKNFKLFAPADGVVTFIIHEGYRVPEGSAKILAEIRTESARKEASNRGLEVLQNQLAYYRKYEAELLGRYSSDSKEMQDFRGRIATIEKRIRAEEIDANLTRKDAASANR